MDIEDLEQKYRYEIITVEDANIEQELKTENSTETLSNQSPTDDAEIVYEGSAPASEPEIIYYNDTPEWTEEKVDLLLKLYLAYLKEFRNPHSKKKDVWKKVGTEMGAGAIACDRKFRNLKQRYVNLMKRGNKKQIAQWPHYQLMVEIFKGDPNFVKTYQQKYGTSNMYSKKYFIAQNEVKMVKKELEDEPAFEKIALNLSKNQAEISSKLDELIDRIKQSNVIQQKRNELFEKYIQTLQRRSKDK